MEISKLPRLTTYIEARNDIDTLTELDWIEKHRNDNTRTTFYPEQQTINPLWMVAIKKEKPVIFEWIVSRPDASASNCYTYVLKNVRVSQRRTFYDCLVRAGKRFCDENVHPIFIAIRQREKDIVEDMINRETVTVLDAIRDPETNNDVMFAALESSWANQTRIWCIKKLIEKGVNYDRRIEPLKNARYDGALSLKRRLIDSFTWIDLSFSKYLADTHGVRPGIQTLQFGLQLANVDIIRFYMKYHALPVRVTVTGRESKRREQVGLLAGLLFMQGNTYPVRDGLNDTIRFLLDAGCDVNIASIPGNVTMFHSRWLNDSYNSIHMDLRIEIFKKAINPNHYAHSPILGSPGSPLDSISAMYKNGWEAVIPFIRYTNARFIEHAVPNEKYDPYHGGFTEPNSALPIIRKFHNRVYYAVALIKSEKLAKDIIRVLVLNYI
jgi:hypothetical protein